MTTTTRDRAGRVSELAWSYAAGALVALICCGLTVPSVLEVGQARTEAHAAVTVQQTSRLCRANSVLMHALQEERGRSQMYLTRRKMVADPLLLVARQNTDTALRAWNAVVALAPAGTADRIAGVRRHIDELMVARPGIRSRNIPGGIDLELEANPIPDLVALSATLTDRAEQTGVGNATQYISLMVSISQLGQERRRIAGSLEIGSTADHESVLIVEAKRGARLQALSIFTLLSSPGQAAELAPIASTPSARFVTEIERAIVDGDRRRISSTAAGVWFSQATTLLEQYYSLLLDENDAMQTRADRLAESAAFRLHRNIALTVSLLIVGLLLGLGLVVLTRRQMARGHQLFDQQSRDDAARIEAILSTASDAIITMDETGLIEGANPSVEQVYGYPPSELIGRNVSILMPDDVAATYDGDLGAYLADRGEQCIGKPRMSTGRRKDGSVVSTEVMTARVLIGNRPLLTSIVRDITDRQQTLDELVERDLAVSQQNHALARSNAELEQFASVASHDLQEPLRKITSYVHILETDYADQHDDQAREYMRLAASASDRMRVLINDLLSLSRIRENSMHVDSCDTRAIVDSIIDDLEIALDEAGAVVTVGDLPVLPGDSAHLRQVFQNVISNAVKYRGKEPPRIDISVCRVAEGWHFLVRDNGIGFRQEYAEQIFGMFKRLVSRKEYEGTGIGLAVVAKIVTNHGGRIWATSELGVGTTIEFILPDAEARPDAVARIPQPRAGSGVRTPARLT